MPRKRPSRRRLFLLAACWSLIGAVGAGSSPANASSPTMPLPGSANVLSAGSNGREVIVTSGSSQDGTAHLGARRIDHVTGTSTPLPDLLAASDDASTIVTDDYRWVDLESKRIVPLPSRVPRDFSFVVASPDGGTVAARQPLGQQNWIVDVDRTTGAASASVLPISGVVRAISRDGRYLLVGTACRIDTLATLPTLDCTGSVRWDRQLRTASSLGGTGRAIGGGIGPRGEVVLIDFDGTTDTRVLNEPGRPEVTLDEAPSGVPSITADGRVVLFTTGSSGFTSYAAYDRISGKTAYLPSRSAIPHIGQHSQQDGRLSTDGSTFVTVDAVSDANRSTTYALLWTPVAVAPSTARLRPDEVLAVHVAGTGGVGADASSALLSVTVTDPSAGGFATVWPCGQERPVASNVNFVARQTRANAVLSLIGASGDICIGSNVAINVVVDVQGWFGPTSSYHALVPTRVVDTRAGTGATSGAVDSAGGLRIPLRASSSIGSSATAVMINVTATNAVADGFVTVWSCAAPRPTASNLNIAPGATVANAVLTSIGASGDICVSSNVPTDIIIDLQGWFEQSVDYRATDPVRLVDTRNGELDVFGNQAAEQTLTVSAESIARLDPGATAGMFNVTITNPDQPGYATVWPCDEARPLASNVNFDAGETVAVAVLARLSADETICIASNTQTDIIVDAFGAIPGASSYHALTPNRLIDTRI